MWAIDWFSKLEFHSQYPPNSIPDDPDALDCFSSYLLMSGHEVLLVHRRICERFVASWFVSMFDGRCGGSGAATGEPWGTPKMTSEHQVKWQFWNRVWARNGRCADVPTRSFSCRTSGKKWDVFAGWIEYVSAKVGSRHWGTKLISRTTSFHAFHIPSLVLRGEIGQLRRWRFRLPTWTLQWMSLFQWLWWQSENLLTEETCVHCVWRRSAGSKGLEMLRRYPAVGSGASVSDVFCVQPK